jgi:DNA-binding Lrp family transcriptional regulator
MDIDQEILRVLQERGPQDRAMTISDFARRFGANPQIILGAARRLVDHHLAEPFMVNVHGIPTLHGLSPLAAQAQPVLSPGQ